MFINDVVMKKIGGSSKEVSDTEGRTIFGCYPLFGFAVMDYMDECCVPEEDIKDKYVFGAVLRTGRIDDEFFAFCRMLMGEPDILLMVFDYNDVTKEEIELLKKNLNGLNGFKELENVYEDRIVFASFN